MKQHDSLHGAPPFFAVGDAVVFVPPHVVITDTDSLDTSDLLEIPAELCQDACRVCVGQVGVVRALVGSPISARQCDRAFNEWKTVATYAYSVQLTDIDQRIIRVKQEWLARLE